MPATSAARWEEVRQMAGGCQACELWARATQTVFGAGPVPAPLMLVGEQPGDQEDQAGSPFVGPAGRELDRALEAAGVRWDGVYVTNAVKHFKWKPRGKRRIHDKPSRLEVVACHPWLEQELELVEPEVLVVMGATAAHALLGPRFPLTPNRGVDLTGTGLAPHVVATNHPSAILRVTDASQRSEARSLLASDLRHAAELVGTAPSRRTSAPGR